MRGVVFLFCAALCVLGFVWVQFMGVTSSIADGMGNVFTLGRVERPFTEHDPIARGVTDKSGVLSAAALIGAVAFIGLAVLSWIRKDEPED